LSIIFKHCSRPISERNRSLNALKHGSEDQETADAKAKWHHWDVHASNVCTNHRLQR